MKCISRSTLGVVIGTLNLLIYIGAIIGTIICLITLNTVVKDASNKSSSNSKNTFGPYGPWNEDDKYFVNTEERDSALIFGYTVLITLLVVSLIMAIISALLIMGIVKRRHTLMAPWLILSAIGFVLGCISSIFGLFGSLLNGAPFGRVFGTFILNCLVLGIEALILYPIYTLYKDIRANNNEHPGQVIGFSNAFTGQINDYTPITHKA